MMLGFTSAFGMEAVRRVREYRNFRETRCTILASSCHIDRGSKGSTSYRIESSFEFGVDGRRQIATDRGESLNAGTREKAELRLAHLAPGTSHPCWYDPTDPTQAVLERRLSHLAPFLPIPICFAVLGLVLLFHFWTGNPLGRLGEFVAGASFSLPWLVFAIGIGGSGFARNIIGGVFGTIGAVGLVGTFYHATKARAKGPP